VILVLDRGTTPEEVEAVLADLRARGVRANVLGGAEAPLIHLAAGRAGDLRRLRRRHERVQALVSTSGPRIRRKGRRFYPYHFLNWCAGGLLLVGALVLLAGHFPVGVGADLDPHRPAADAPTPWYLRAPAAVIALLPGGLGWVVLAAVALAVVLLPMLDRSEGTRTASRSMVILAGVVLAAAYVLLTIRGAP
jgi:quinol-cytochrome oxidoreductase complex cytochrome b subunit